MFRFGRSRRACPPVTRRLRLETLEDRQLMAVAPPSVPVLSSRPGAAATLYLDFNGHVERQWGGHTNVTTPAYDTDGNPANFSSSELSAIREIWARVSEDYAPFNINVTTVAPPTIADRVAARVVIGGGYGDWYGHSAGGVSYVGGFSGPASNVAYVFSKTLAGGNPRYAAEAASHEAGHLFGLEHQATWSGGTLVEEYASGTASLAPIMGASYYATRTTWSSGPTDEGPTAREDALTILARSANGFGYTADDYGNTIAAARALPLSGSSTTIAGLIGKNDDRDVFKFTTGGGAASFNLAVAPYGANLDGVLELQNSAGTTIATANPSQTLGATLSKSLTAGTYYVVVRSSGGYGNLGRYSLSGTIAAAAVTPPITTPPPAGDLPEGEGTPPPPPSTSSVIVIDDGSAGFSRAGSWQQIAGAGFASDTQWAAANSSSAASWTFAGLAPGKYRIAATWKGSSLNSSAAPLTVTSAGKTLLATKINQQRSASTFTSGGAAWQNLGTVTVTGNSLVVRLNSATTGRVVADALRLERVYSTTGGSFYTQATLAEAELLATTIDEQQPRRTNLAPSAVDAVFNECGDS
jgi:hypothetical protein